jgi:hypothetical protein
MDERDGADPLEKLAALMAQRQLELEAKGYSEDVARGAIRRSYRWAREFASEFPEERRSEAMYLLFKRHSETAEHWAEGIVRRMAAPEAASDEEVSSDVTPASEEA